MNKNRILLLLFCIISFASKAQTQIANIEKKLLDSSALRISLKTYILLETDTFILFTPGKYFFDPFEIWVKEHPQFIDDKTLFKAIKSDTARRLVRANKIAIEYNLTKRMNLQIAECLKIGKCIIYNKTTKRLEKTITIDDSLVENHGELRFIVSGSFLFKVND